VVYVCVSQEGSAAGGRVFLSYIFFTDLADSLFMVCIKVTEGEGALCLLLLSRPVLQANKQRTAQ
jgi:hypothetical protein